MTTYRPATPNDHPGIERLLTQLHPDASSILPLIHQQAQTFVATHQSNILGVAVVTFTNYGHAPYGVLEELVVDESTRNTGIGTTLLTQALTWLESAGAEVVFVSALNEKAVAFYRSTNFTPCTGPWLFWTPSEPELESTQSK
jgi:N-acetylglutamate synthase-like GNAT family acetyltransferase